MQLQANTFLTLHTALFTPRTPHFTPALHLNSSHLSSSHLISCLLICQLSSSYFHFIWAQLNLSHLTETGLNSSRLCCTSECYFVLKSLRRVLPSTTLYYKVCTKHYFVLQSLCKARPSTTLYYEACTKKAFTHGKFFRREAFTHRKLFKQRSFYAQKFLHTTSFYTKKLLHTQTHSKLLQKKFLRREVFRNCSSKTGSRCQSKTKHDFEAFFKRNFTRKIAS